MKLYQILAGTIGARENCRNKNPEMVRAAPTNHRHACHRSEGGIMKLARNSSLRKLARAIAHRKVPDERQVIIDNALVNAHRRFKVYQNRKARKP
jgi:hypothetical protein